MQVEVGKYYVNKSGQITKITEMHFCQILFQKRFRTELGYCVWSSGKFEGINKDFQDLLYEVPENHGFEVGKIYYDINWDKYVIISTTAFDEQNLGRCMVVADKFGAIHRYRLDGTSKYRPNITLKLPLLPLQLNKKYKTESGAVIHLRIKDIHFKNLLKDPDYGEEILWHIPTGVYTPPGKHTIKVNTGLPHPLDIIGFAD